MRCLGVDPGSTTIGLAVVEGKEPRWIAEVDVRKLAGVKKGAWDQNDIPRALHSFYAHLRWVILGNKVDAGAVELLSVSQNMDTVRKIAYFEGASLLAFRSCGVPVRSVKTTTARKAVFGKGNTKKDQVPGLLADRFAHVYTADEADALTFGLWAEMQDWSEDFAALQSSLSDSPNLTR